MTIHKSLNRTLGKLSIIPALHCNCTASIMRTAMLPAVRVTEELRADAERVLAEGETLSSFIETTLLKAIEHRQVQADFEARAEASYQDYQRTGIWQPIDEVFDRLEAKIAARRKEIAD